MTHVKLNPVQENSRPSDGPRAFARLNDHDDTILRNMTLTRHSYEILRRALLWC